MLEFEKLGRIVWFTAPDIRKVAEDLDFGLALFFSVLVVQNDVGIVGQGGMRRQNSCGKRHASQCPGHPRPVQSSHRISLDAVFPRTIAAQLLPIGWPSPNAMSSSK